MFERFTDPARRVIAYAQEESRLLAHDHIGTEHLLLGLLHDGDDPTGQALQSAGVTLADLRQRIEASTGRGRKPTRGHVPFTPRVKQALEQSLRQAQRLGQDHIAEPHLLLGVLKVRDSTGTRMLIDLDVDIDALATVADELAIATGPSTESGPSRAGAISLARVHAARPTGWVGPKSRVRRTSMRDLAVHAAQVAEQRDRFARGLQRHARHDDNCEGAQVCTCGLTSLLEAAAADLEHG
jgi:ATP-dependent Clp protease ATP-binding subunit ClpA